MAKKKAVEKKGPANNIIFVGKDSEPIPAIYQQGKVIELPDTATQIKGFYHEDAGEVCALFPSLYKRLTEKGS